MIRPATAHLPRARAHPSPSNRPAFMLMSGLENTGSRQMEERDFLESIPGPVDNDLTPARRARVPPRSAYASYPTVCREVRELSQIGSRCRRTGRSGRSWAVISASAGNSGGRTRRDPGRRQPSSWCAGRQSITQRVIRHHRSSIGNRGSEVRIIHTPHVQHPALHHSPLHDPEIQRRLLPVHRDHLGRRDRLALRGSRNTHERVRRARQSRSASRCG